MRATRGTGKRWKNDLNKILASISVALSLAAPPLAAQDLPPIQPETATPRQLLSPDPNIQNQQFTALAAIHQQIIAAQNSDKTIELDNLFALLKTAKTEIEARYIADYIWNYWVDAAPTPAVGEMLKQAMERRRWYDFEGARLILNDAINAAPNYAEVWNQRAYILFLQEKFDESLVDIDRALTLEPRHFGALSGKARILTQKGAHDEAQAVLRQAVDLYPWIFERALLRSQTTEKEAPAKP